VTTLFARSTFAIILLGFAASDFGFAQPLRFKTREIDTSARGPVQEIPSTRILGRQHLLLQFATQPSAETVAELTRRGVDVWQDVPEKGLLVTVGSRVSVQDLGVVYAAPIEPQDKISPIVGKSTNGFLLVEFHPDVDSNTARGLILSRGIEFLENPDLQIHHLMIRSDSSASLTRMAQLDEVAYIFPASDALARGIPTRACAGALTTNGSTAQSIPTYGDGWDGPGLGAATISYVFSQMTAQLPTAAAEAEIESAMAQWTNAVQVAWKRGSDPTGPETVNIMFATGAHGDGFPFDGPGGVLAHTFYPAPPNPEPIAGDMHFDDAESWHIGANTDLFSVALHELGHSLGLGHADDPTAVMYPYYQMATGLSPLDISVVQTLYAANTNTGSTQPPVAAPPTTTPPSAPLTLNVNAPSATTTASSINLSGTTSGGSGAVVVSWVTSQGTSGTAIGSASWTISGLALATGSNTITITATSGAARVSSSIKVTRQAASTPTDTTPPALTITSPSSTSVSTSAASIVLSGTASDNVGVTAVTWSTNVGQSGVASGTAQWSATVPLLVGSNTVTVKASDAAGNSGWRTVVVARH
jgi:hypothetical protein